MLDKVKQWEIPVCSGPEISFRVRVFAAVKDISCAGNAQPGYQAVAVDCSECSRNADFTISEFQLCTEQHEQVPAQAAHQEFPFLY